MSPPARPAADGGFRAVPPPVRKVIWLTSFAAIGVGYLMTYFVAYLPETGVSSSDVGLIIATLSISTILAAIPLGMLSDRLGRKNVLLFALCMFPLILVACALTKEIEVLLVIAVFGGIAEGAFFTAWNALIADQTDIANRNAAFALSFIANTTMIGLGSALPILFPFIEGVFGYGSGEVHSGAFLVIGAASTLSPIGIHWELRHYRERKRAKRDRQPILRAETKRNLIRFSAINLLLGLGAGFIIALIPTWLWLKFGIPDALSGPLLAVSGVTMAFASLASSRIAFRYGPVRAITLTQGISTAFLLLIPLMPGPGLASIAFVLRSMFMNMSSPISDSFLMSIISKNERGLASAINNIVWRLPNSVTTVFGGMLLAAGFYDLPFFITAACYVTAIILFYRLFKNVRPLG